MTRRELRERIFLMLFRVEFHSDNEIDDQLSLFLDHHEVITDDEDNPLLKMEAMDLEDEKYVLDKFKLVLSKLPEIDKLINEKTKGWKTSRMAKVDLALIRLGAYEMLFDDDVPVAVAIDEAVELAKIFGTDDSASFVNGVLARLS